MQVSHRVIRDTVLGPRRPSGKVNDAFVVSAQDDEGTPASYNTPRAIGSLYYGHPLVRTFVLIKM
jgi:hypothetical protein